MTDLKKKLFKGKNFDISLFDFKISGQKFYHEIIEQNSAAAVLAIENEKIIMVKQFRYPHKNSLEIPAGIKKKNETSLKCAKRELLEETGYSCSNLKFLTRFYPSIGYNLQYIDCFFTTNLKKISNQKLDDDEFVTVKKIPIKKLLSMIKSDKILDSKTISAVMIYAAKTNILK